jgi:hypothetical protein
MKFYDLDLVPGRECGSCTACCTAMAIDQPDIQKEAGVTCRHCTGVACAIYDVRPSLCRDFHCGWRQLPILDENWRPDLSGVFVEIEAIAEETAISLVLIANPLKTLRQSWFLDFVMTGVASDVPLHLGMPGPKGFQGASVPLNTQQMFEAAHISRARVKEILEKELKRLTSFRFEPRRFKNTGHDVGG